MALIGTYVVSLQLSAMNYPSLDFYFMGHIICKYTFLLWLFAVSPHLLFILHFPVVVLLCVCCICSCLKGAFDCFPEKCVPVCKSTLSLALEMKRYINTCGSIACLKLF